VSDVRRIENGGDPVYYQFEQWAGGERLTHGVFTRLGGVSAAPWSSLNVGGTVGDDPAAVRENARRIYAALGLDGAGACTVWQVHSADVALADAPAQGRRWLARADGMITRRRGLPLTMRYADCAPILLYDPVQHALGMAHAGWRGTVLGAGVSTLRALVETFGTRPQNVQAAIGPSIGPERYQVGEEVVAAVAQAFGDADGLIRRAADGRATLDLWEANRRALARAGVEQIEVAGLCTATRTDEFFSHRAEAGRTGRFGVVAALA
jgi:YfiH family protein